MKTVFQRVDPLRLFALILFTLPTLALFGFGILWLWQAGNLLYWLAGMLLSSLLGYGLQQWLVQKDRKLLAEVITEPNPDWPLNTDKVWQKVNELADATDPKNWPLDEEKWVLELGQRTLETVSNHYHPEVDKPLLELTVPHMLLIIELASRDLRQDISENIPFSDHLTIGDLFKIRRWKSKADDAFDVYRAGRMLVNPLSGVTSELWRHLRDRSFNVAGNELHRWLLRAYIRKVGYYAIDLYSGRQPLEQEETTASVTDTSNADRDKVADNTVTPEEPLRIFVLGRTNSGKSSLINALFEDLAPDISPLSDTTQTLNPYDLQHQGLTQALIYDTPGCDSEHFDKALIEQVAKMADLVLWVTPANRPDRQFEHNYLAALRASQALQTDRRTAPILVVMTHIDQIRPMRHWQPPYDLNSSQETKVVNIRTAMQVLARNLELPISQVIPVCLKEGNVYNVDDTLWATIMGHQDEALRVRLQRCLNDKKQSIDWKKLSNQMINTGRFLKKLPDILGQRSDK